MQLSADQLISKGIVLLLQSQPFYASLVLRMNIQPSVQIETACTNGKEILYSPAFISGLNLREVAGLLAHEVLHVANFHHTRRGRRAPKRWNHACDYAINPILLTAGMLLPAGGLVNPAFFGMTAEQIYERIPEVPEDADAGFGEVMDSPPGEGTKSEKEAEVRSALAQALTAARLRGEEISDDLARIVKQALQPQVDWREALAAFVTETVRGDYTWAKPAVRFLHQGLYLPMLESTETGRIILIVDTSGSIDGELIDQFGGEVKSIADIFCVQLTVIYVDTEVRAVQEFEPGEDIHLKPSGGGGTDFRPGFAYIEKNELEPRAVVYLTDGECTRYSAEPDYPVLWCQFGQGYFTPPFGQVIQIDNYQDH